MIRPIAAADKAQWTPLFVAYGVFYETAFTPDIVDAVFAKLVSDSLELEGLVAETDGALTGFVLYRRLYDSFTAGPGWHLDDLYVHPSARGTGTATALIEAVTAHASAQGGGTVRWITAHDNLTAQSVYDKIAERKTWVTYEKDS